MRAVEIWPVTSIVPRAYLFGKPITADDAQFVSSAGDDFVPVIRFELKGDGISMGTNHAGATRHVLPVLNQQAKRLTAFFPRRRAAP